MKPITESDMIQFVGLKDLEPMEQELVQRISTENFEKIKRMLSNITKLKIQIKTHKKQGKRKKYSIHLQARVPGGPLDVDKSQDYDLARAIHKGFADIKGMIEHRIHLEGIKGTKKTR